MKHTPRASVLITVDEKVAVQLFDMIFSDSDGLGRSERAVPSLPHSPFHILLVTLKDLI